MSCCLVSFSVLRYGQTTVTGKVKLREIKIKGPLKRTFLENFEIMISWFQFQPLLWCQGSSFFGHLSYCLGVGGGGGLLHGITYSFIIDPLKNQND